MVCRHSLLDRVPIAVSPDYAASAAFLFTAWILDFTTSTYCDFPEIYTPKALWTYDNYSESVGLMTISFIPV